MNAIVLAGGKSSRYGSDKALLKLENQTMIELIVENLRKIFNKIYVISNADEYSFLEDVVFAEDIIPGKGPLGGLYTGLKISDEKYNFLTACDMPFLSAEFFKFLKKQKKGYDVLVPEYRAYLEPLSGIYTTDLIPYIKRALSNNQLKIKSFFPEVNLKVIKEEEIREIADPEILFFNINYKDDFHKIKNISK